MTAHSSGTGSSWNETLDVDQPHGLDYREWNDIRIGTRKRMAQEHESFADSTAGGVHMPGETAIMGMEDGTPANTTSRGRGVVWDTSSRLWCNTSVAGVSTAYSPCILSIHPDKQWGGGDITWAGAHEFDASIDVTGNLFVHGSIAAEASADFSDVAATGDVSIDGTLAMQNTVLTGDSTFTFDAIAGETGPTFAIFGDWSARAMDTTYAAARTDGIVVAYAEMLDVSFAGMRIQSPYGTDRQYVRATMADPTTTAFQYSLTCPVKKGDTWALRSQDSTSHNASLVYWIPIGDNT
jgi:hypothetical protein